MLLHEIYIYTILNIMFYKHNFHIYFLIYCLYFSILEEVGSIVLKYCFVWLVITMLIMLSFIHHLLITITMFLLKYWEHFEEMFLCYNMHSDICSKFKLYCVTCIHGVKYSKVIQYLELSKLILSTFFSDLTYYLSLIFNGYYCVHFWFWSSSCCSYMDFLQLIFCL